MYWEEVKTKKEWSGLSERSQYLSLDIQVGCFYNCFGLFGQTKKLNMYI